MSKNKKAPEKPPKKSTKEDQTYASDESGVYERYGLSTHSRVYAEYINQNKSRSRITVRDMSFIRNQKKK